MTETTTDTPRRSRWPMILYWLAAISLTFVGAGWYTQSALLNSDVEGLMDDGSDAALAAIEVHHADGSAQPLADFRGRYLLLDFWASWCPYCRISMPAFEALQKKYPDTLTVLAVNTQESFNDGQAWMKQQDLDLTLVRSEALVDKLAIRMLPSSVLLDPQGKRIWATVGFVPLITPALLEKELQP